MIFRSATLEDCPLLADLNYQLIRDERHRNPMTVTELDRRMRDWLSVGYRAVLFENDGEVVAYALFLEQPEEIYLRQFFVAGNHRGRGIGRNAVELLRSKVWPPAKRLTVDVLSTNQRGLAFWRSVGYKDYSLTLELLPDNPPGS